MHRGLAIVAIVVGCRSDDATTSAPQPPPTVVAPIDAAIVPYDAITFVPAYDPASGMHVDDDSVDRSTTGGAGGVTPRSRRTLEILLRSTPTGATAVVDGRVIGRTPTHREGEVPGQPRDFTFLLPGHALARYSFVPTSSGIVHARLTRITSDGDAGVPAIPQFPVVQPQPQPVRRPDAAPAPTDAATAPLLEDGAPIRPSI